jgi:hypothetical protein
MAIGSCRSIVVFLERQEFMSQHTSAAKRKTIKSATNMGRRRGFALRYKLRPDTCIRRAWEIDAVTVEFLCRPSLFSNALNQFESWGNRAYLLMLWPSACLCSCARLCADGGFISCIEDIDSWLVSIADRCETSRLRVLPRLVLSLV